MSLINIEMKCKNKEKSHRPQLSLEYLEFTPGCTSGNIAIIKTTKPSSYLSSLMKYETTPPIIPPLECPMDIQLGAIL